MLEINTRLIPNPFIVLYTLSAGHSDERGVVLAHVDVRGVLWHMWRTPYIWVACRNEVRPEY